MEARDQRVQILVAAQNLGFGEVRGAHGHVSGDVRFRVRKDIEIVQIGARSTHAAVQDGALLRLGLGEFYGRSDIGSRVQRAHEA